MSAPFTPSRVDGRSDRQVILDLAADAEPGTAYDYRVLTEALQVGLDGEIDRGRVYRAVAAANRTLLREQRRYLGVVKGTGYRVLAASEHLPEAVGKKERAETYIRRGVELLRHARLDELDEAQRTLHQGQLLVLDGLYRAVRASEIRHERQEQALDDLRRRVAQLEEVAS